MDATVNVFENIFTHHYTVIHVDEPKSIADILAGQDLTNAVIGVNGKAETKKYVVKDGDICAVRLCPSGAVGNAIASAFNFVVNKVSEAVQGLVKWAQDGLRSWMMGGSAGSGADSGNTPESLQSIPMLRGAKNQSGFGKVIPFILGKHKLTPYYVGKSYVTIDGEDGEDEYFNTLLLLGYGELEVTDIKLGEILVSSNHNGARNGYLAIDGRFPDVQLELLQGEYSESAIYPQKVVEEQISIELIKPSDGGTQNFPIRFTAQNPQTVQIEFTCQGLISYNDSGDKIDATASATIQWRRTGESDSQWKSFGTFSKTRQKNKVMRWIVERTFTRAEVEASGDRVIEIRAYRTNDNAADTRTTDKLYWTAIRTWCYDYEASKAAGYMISQKPVVEKERDRTCRLGVRIKATSDVSGMIDSINCIVQSCARVWSSVNKTWSEIGIGEQPTNNPAAVALKLMQSPMLGQDAFTEEDNGADSKYVDLQAFGELYEWCEQKNLKCNGVMTSQKRLDETLDAIFNTCRALRILNGPQYSVLIDKPRTQPVTILNSQNVLEASNQKSFQDLPAGYKIKFIDEYDGYMENELYAMYPNPDGSTKSKPLPGDRVESLDIPYVTDRNQVWKHGMYELAKRKLRPETWSRKVSVDGYLIGIGSLVEVQDDTILVGIGEGAEITGLIYDDGNNIIGVKTDGMFDVVDTPKTYGIKIMQFDGVHAGTARILQVTNITEQNVYSEFRFAPISPVETVRPTVGDIVAFGIYDRVTTDALCFGKKDNGDGTFDLTLIPYSAGVYTADTGVIPEFDSKLTAPQGMAVIPEDPPKDYATKGDVAEGVGAVLGTSDEPPDNIENLTARATRDGIALSWTFNGQGIKNSLRRIRLEVRKAPDDDWTLIDTLGASYLYPLDGYYEAKDFASWRFRAKAENLSLQLSPAYAGSEDGVEVDVSSYGTWIPPAPANVTAAAERDGIRGGFDFTPGNFYGTAKFRVHIFKDDVEIKTLNTLTPDYFYSFVRGVDGYPERSTVPGDYPKLDIYRVSVEAVSAETGDVADSGKFSVDETGYGTWIPPAPANVTAAAERDGIRGGFDFLPLNLYGDTRFRVHVAYDGEERAVIATQETAYLYLFDRAVDGYPERSGIAGDYPSLGNYRVFVEAVNTETQRSAASPNSSVHEEAYRTWIPPSPLPALSVSGRTVTAAWRPPVEQLYGTLAFDVAIAKHHEVDGSEDAVDLSLDSSWHAPAAAGAPIYQLGEDYQTLLDQKDPANDGYLYHYGDLPSAWRAEGASRNIAGTAFTFMAPLDQKTVLTSQETESGETEQKLVSCAIDTVFYLRVRAVNIESGRVSAWSGPDGLGEAVSAAATSARDVVENALTGANFVPKSIGAEKIYARDLAAISANMGVITDGAMAGNAFNYWALSTILNEAGQVEFHQGEFRVGGSDQFLKVTPVVVDGAITDYHIEFHMGIFTIDASASKLNGELIVQMGDDATDRARLLPHEMVFEHRDSEQDEWRAIASTGVSGIQVPMVTNDKYLTLTNATILERRAMDVDIGLAYLSPASEVYHFDINSLDQHGQSHISIDHNGAPPMLVDGKDSTDAIDFTPAILAVAPYSETGRSLYGQFSVAASRTAGVFTVEFWAQFVWAESQALFSIGDINETLSLSIVNAEGYYNTEFDDDVPYNKDILAENEFVYNNIADTDQTLTRTTQGGSSQISLPDYDMNIHARKWHHIAVTRTQDKFVFMLDDKKIEFDRLTGEASAVSIVLNAGKGSFVLDELNIDNTAAVAFTAFQENTVKKIPYGALDKDDDWLVLAAKDPNKVRTNIFDTPQFAEKVLAIVNGMSP